MQRTHASLFAAAILSMAALLLGPSQAHAQRGRYIYHGGYYRPYGFYPYGYRPYPFIGVGIGIGLYAPYYGSYAYPIAPGVVYNPYPVAVVGAAPQAPPASVQAPTEKPAPDSAAHLQLIVPEQAEVLIDGNRISQNGKVREIVSPTLQPAAGYTYRISVRYTGSKGEPVDDTREIRFHANDWFTIDFTRPAPPPAAAAPPAPLTLQVVPSPTK